MTAPGCATRRDILAERSVAVGAGMPPGHPVVVALAVIVGAPRARRAGECDSGILRDNVPDAPEPRRMEGGGIRAVRKIEAGRPCEADPRQRSVLSGGSDGIRSRARTTTTGWVIVAAPGERRKVGASGRVPYLRRRPTRLTEAERAQVASLAETRSLRSLAADYGVSHETIGAVLREANRSSLATVAG